MANVTVTIKNDASPEVKAAMKSKIRVALNAAGIQAATLARNELQKTPKREDTGLLRNSITHAMDGKGASISSYKADRASKYNGKKPEPGHYEGTTPSEPECKAAVYVGTNVEYAIYVHEGTDRMAPNRFIKNAIETYSDELVSIIKDHLMGENDA